MPESVFDEDSLPGCDHLHASVVELDWHGFRLRKALAEDPPPTLLHGVAFTSHNPPRGWGDGEDRVTVVTVRFKRLNDGSGRYVCGGCPLCRPWEFSRVATAP